MRHCVKVAEEMIAREVEEEEIRKVDMAPLQKVLVGEVMVSTSYCARMGYCIFYPISYF